MSKIAAKPKTNIIKLLLEYGADVSAKDEKGATALEWANEMNFKEAAELMDNFSSTKTEK